MLVKIRTDIPLQFHSFSDPEINGDLKELMEKKRAAGMTEQADYIKSKIDGEKKGF